MMKCRLVLKVLSAIGVVALSSTVAQAGDGGSPVALTGFFVCHSINGSNVGHVVDMQGSTFGERLRVRIGSGTLACAFTKLFTPGTNFAAELEPNPVAGLGTEGQMKCYTASVPRQPGGGTAPGTFTVTDMLYQSSPTSNTVAGTETVLASDIRLVCGPAQLLQSP